MSRDNETLLEHSLPSSDDAEQVCLGSVLLENSLIEQCMKYFGPEDLYSPFHRRVYGAMIEVWQLNKPIDPVTILEQLKTKEDRPDEWIRATEIANLTFGLPYVTDLTEYATIIKTHSVSRQAIKLANSVTRDLIAGDVDAREIIAKLEQRAMQLSTKLDTENKQGTTGFVSVQELGPVIKAQFEAYHRGEATGIKTGMHELDRVLDGGGLQRKGTYVIGGREKSGKTSLALRWCHETAVVHGQTALIITLEMSKETLLKRLYSQHSGIPYYMFRPGFYDTNIDNPYTRAIQGLDEFCRYPFKIADNLFTMEAIYRHCTKQVELGQKPDEPEVGVIAIDYLQLIGLDDSRTSTVERVTQVSRKVKNLASELDVPVIVMSNMNRKTFGDTSKESVATEPDIDNLRDSGSIAFDAEAVLFVHNPSMIPGRPYEQKEITDYLLILSRQRNGPTARIPMKFIGPYMQFVTEAEYQKAQNNQQELPPTLGQQLLQEKEIDDLWDDEFTKGGEDPRTDHIHSDPDAQQARRQDSDDDWDNL